eukprot:g486.t1
MSTIIDLCDDSSQDNDDDDDDDVVCIVDKVMKGNVVSKERGRRDGGRLEVICLEEEEEEVEVVAVDAATAPTNSSAVSGGSENSSVLGTRKRKRVEEVSGDDVVVVKETKPKKTIPKKGVDRRLFREREKMLQKSPEGIQFMTKKSDARTWFLRITGARDTLYAGKTYRLRFRFSDQYPIKPPEVVFVGGSPIHEHIYSNGHICLSILYDQWSPALSVNSVCLSILSMMSSCKKEGFRRPGNDASYVIESEGKSPLDMEWSYHDDEC